MELNRGRHSSNFLKQKEWCALQVSNLRFETYLRNMLKTLILKTR